jgi:phage shock protein C
MSGRERRLEVMTMSEKKLVRLENDRMLFGVAGGVAYYLDLDPTLIRLFFVLLTLTTGYGLILYFLMALLMPVERLVAKANAFDEEEIVIKDVV